MLDVTRLRVLAAVARLGSVTAAARELRYAQPSVSHHLARLEAETGTRLVQRAGRGIRLTEAGRVLAARAEEILGRLDAAEEELAAHAGLRAGRVRLAAFPSALGTFVPTAVTGLREAHPEVEIELVDAEPPEAVALLKTGEVEVALLFDYAVAETDGLRRIPLLREPLYLVSRDGGRLVEHERTPWIAGCERCRAQLVRLCADAGFTPRIAYTTDDYVAVQSLVAAGLGVTVLPELAITAHRHPLVRSEPIPGAERAIVAAVYGDPPDPPATAALLRYLTEATAPAS